MKSRFVMSCICTAVVLYSGCTPSTETKTTPYENPIASLVFIESPAPNAPDAFAFAHATNAARVYWPIPGVVRSDSPKTIWYLGRIDGCMGCWFGTASEECVGGGPFPDIESAATWLVNYSYERNKGIVDDKVLVAEDDETPVHVCE